jgi:hypothetical protein
VHEQFHQLVSGIDGAKSLLERAGREGMDVADAEMALSQANDALAKARVSLHSAQPALVAADVEAGAKTVAQAKDAGNIALKERDRRKKSVVFPVIALVFLFVSAGLYVRALEKTSS